MPAKSASQFRLMQGIAHGSIKPKGSLTPAKAAEFVQGQSLKGLPEKANAKGRKLQRGRQMKKSKGVKDNVSQLNGRLNNGRSKKKSNTKGVRENDAIDDRIY